MRNGTCASEERAFHGAQLYMRGVGTWVRGRGGRRRVHPANQQPPNPRTHVPPNPRPPLLQCPAGLRLAGGGFVITIVPFAVQLCPSPETVTDHTYVPGAVYACEAVVLDDDESSPKVQSTVAPSHGGAARVKTTGTFVTAASATSVPHIAPHVAGAMAIALLRAVWLSTVTKTKYVPGSSDEGMVTVSAVGTEAPGASTPDVCDASR